MDHSVSEVSEGEASDDCLKIVWESPKRKTKKKFTSDDLPDKKIIESMESELDDILDEKVAKTNLTVVNVKSILKEVASNEHVIALLKRSEDPNTSSETVFEPKLTRAKVKELFSSAPVQSHPLLITSKPPSEVQQLIANEFAEDSSGDEYIPADESEDDRESSVISETEVRSVSPSTPNKNDSTINWTDDGIFKIPPTKTVEEKTEDATVALRTRSKLSLNDIPLEEIESAFMPPDITPDMYEMECDNDLWSDFLRMFSTKPLDEVTKATEDEDHDEHDPSYNILADEAINQVDVEDFRADKAVNVPRKELNELIAGLGDYIDAYDDNTANSSKADLSAQSKVETTVNVEQLQKVSDVSVVTNSVIQPSCDNTLNEAMRVDQKLLLGQQMRQHVQMLTQNFLLTFENVEFHEFALESKVNLINLKILAGDNENSCYKASNLDKALELINDWEEQFSQNTDDVKKMKEHIVKVIDESKRYFACNGQYVVTLSALILQTMSNSDVFIYPFLLPKIPFKTASVIGKTGFTKSEDQLIAIAMEQFIPQLAKDKHNLTYRGEVALKTTCATIVQYMLPTKTMTQLYQHIYNSKHPQNPMNPIKYYFQHQKAPPTLHYVISISEYGFLAPCKRDKNQLPYQFQQFLYPDENKVQVTNVITKVVKPPAFIKSFTRSPIRRKHARALDVSNSVGSKRRDVVSCKRAIFCSTPKPTGTVKKLEQYFRSPQPQKLQKADETCLKCMKFNSSIFKNLSSTTMLPSMPNLRLFYESAAELTGASSSNTSKDEATLTETSQVADTTLSTTKSTDALLKGSEESFKSSEVVEVEAEEVKEKDNEDDINALMAASANIKSLGRKYPSGTEKKKAKLRRESTATLKMLSAQEPAILEEKDQSYAQAYFDKALERLSPEEYEQFLEVFYTFQEGKSSVVELYKKIESILGKNNPDLMEEFLTFLTPGQAKDVGKLIPYYMLSNMSFFLRKLEIYFKDQPSQLRKIYRSLIELTNCVNVTMERVKNTILPLLKGNNLLTDWFLQIFPTEPPPDSLLRGPWEQVNIKRGLDENQVDSFESIAVPDVEDQYGGPSCICSCHQNEDTKSRLQHCIPCGMKFLQGRVYVQTGKGLRLANVSFDSNSDVDHNLRLNCSPDKKKRRADISPSKQQPSPHKEYQEEVRVTVDSEDDESTRKKVRSRSPRKKRVKLNDKPDKITPNEAEELTSQPESSQDLAQSKLDDALPTQAPTDVTEEIAQWEFNASAEFPEARASPEHSAESESEFCEESSQDNINTETDESELESLSNSPIHSDNSNSNTFEQITWNRDEDKIILETLQKEGNKEDTFVRISKLLENRTVSQIRERFSTLMSLLQKMQSLTK